MYLISRQFVDGLGRKLMTKTEAEPRTGEHALVRSRSHLFNARQKTCRVLNPFFTVALAGRARRNLAFENIEAPAGRASSTTKAASSPSTSPPPTRPRPSYDATLREPEAINPDGTFSRTVYEPLLTRSFDENDTDPASAYSDTPMVHYTRRPRPPGPRGRNRPAERRRQARRRLCAPGPPATNTTSTTSSPASPTPRT